MSSAGGRRPRPGRAIVVEGRDDVAAVSRVTDALIIPTHGFGITKETWDVIARANDELGLIILTDPDHAGEQIRRKLTERFPDAVQAYIAREDATDAGDIGVENAGPDVIREALEKALGRAESGRERAGADDQKEMVFAAMSDLAELGLAGCEGASERRAAVCRSLGIGYGNAAAVIKKLKGFGIGRDELRQEVEKIRKE